MTTHEELFQRPDLSLRIFFKVLKHFCIGTEVVHLSTRCHPLPAGQSVPNMTEIVSFKFFVEVL